MVSDKVEIHITYNLQFDSYLRASWWEESEKAGLEFNIQKTKITASIPITLWQIEGEKVETVTGFIFLGSKITADGDCGHEIKRRFLLGRKVTINLNSILKGRYITLLTKVRRVKAMVFPVIMCGCESWTVKKAEHQRTDAFEQAFCREGQAGASCPGGTPSSPSPRLAALCPASRVRVQLTPCEGHLWRCRGVCSHGFMTPLRNWEETFFLKSLGGLLHEIRLWQFF